EGRIDRLLTGIETTIPHGLWRELESERENSMFAVGPVRRIARSDVEITRLLGRVFIPPRHGRGHLFENREIGFVIHRIVGVTPRIENEFRIGMEREKDSRV